MDSPAHKTESDEQLKKGKATQYDGPAPIESQTTALPPFDHLTANQPPPLSAQNVLWLQRMVGNRAVQELVQRDLEDEDDTDTDLPRGILGMREWDDFEQRLRYLEATPAFEVIAGATGAETSDGRLEQRAEYLWRREHIRFTEGARQLAGQRPLQDDAHPTQSPHQAPGQTYSHRTGLSFLAYDYPPVINDRFFRRNSDDLSDIRGMMRQGSTFRRAFEAEFEQPPQIVENPAAQTIEDRIRGTVEQMRSSMPDGQIGELVVHFSGHGSNGGMIGVDGNPFTREQIRAVGESARRQGIHIVFIMDICFSGNAVSEAQSSATASLLNRANSLPTAEMQAVYGVLGTAQTLIHQSMQVSERAEALSNAAYFHGIRARDFRANVAPLIQPLRDQLARFTQALNPTEDYQTSMDPLPAGDLEELRTMVEQAQANLAPDRVRGRAGVENNVERLGTLLDRACDVINTLIQRGQQMIEAARPD